MPKDSSSSSGSTLQVPSNPASSSVTTSPSSADPPAEASSKPPPLKRGDACLYCRKRRIRCSATKPSCHHCTKLGRECVYDTGKPTSRVRKLEDKVAELEGYLRAAAEQQERQAARLMSAYGPSAAAAGVSGVVTTSGGGVGFGDQLADPTYSNAGQGQALHDLQAETQSHHAQLQQQQQQPHTTQYSLPPGSIDQSTIDITMLDNFTPAPGIDTTRRMGLSTGLSGFPDSLMDGMDSRQQYQYGSGAFPESTRASFQSRGSFQGTSPPVSLPEQHQQQQQQPGQLPPASPPLDWDTLNPGIMGLVGEMGRATTCTTDSGIPGDSIISRLLAHPSTVPRTAAMSSMAATFPEQTPVPPLPPPRQSYVVEAVEALDDNMDGTGGNAGHGDFSLPEAPPEGNGKPASSVMGGWFDPNDLPHAARDHLLEVFFKQVRLFSQMIHVPRFMASLSLPPSKRPHPCLLYAMYTMVARYSSDPKLRALEPHFSEIARARLSESISRSDRLFDACRAANLIAVYDFSHARYASGWVMTCQSATLATMCGLHLIRSSVFKPRRPGLSGLASVNLMRQRPIDIFSARNPVDHGERIWAFWATYVTSRSGATSGQWSVETAIGDSIINTPFPRPLYEYELGIVSTKDDYTIRDLFNDERPAPRLPYDDPGTSTVLYMQALCLVERASKLQYLPTEPGVALEDESPGPTGSKHSSDVSPTTDIDDYLQYQNNGLQGLEESGGPVGAGVGAGPGAGNGQGSRSGSTQGLSPGTKQKAARGSNRTARIRTPKAYQEVRNALVRLEEALPEEHRTEWGLWDGSVQPWHFQTPNKDTVTLYFLTGTAWMFLLDVYAYMAENTEAVACARRMAYTVRIIQTWPLMRDIDVFLAMCWSFQTMILMRESRRLKALGDIPGSQELDAEVEVVMSAMRTAMPGLRIGADQAQRTAAAREVGDVLEAAGVKDEEEEEDE